MQHDIIETKARIRRAIERIAFVRGEETPFVSGKNVRNTGWIFDIKKILLSPDILEDLGELFWDTFPADRTVQIAGLESAAIPLITGLVMHSHYRAHEKPASGFYMRKSRKREGLLKTIEGTIAEKTPIVLVDDALNSGKTFIRQVQLLETLGYTVEALWVLVRYREPEFYEYFSEKGIAIHALFTLDDFTATLGTRNLAKKSPREYVMPFTNIWKFQSPNPSYYYVVPKSDPALDAARVYVGSDIGTLWALNQNDGSIAWRFEVERHRTKGKGIFSSPALHDDTVFFGAYDGNFYALDAATGRKKWTYLDADWIGSSPALAPDIGLAFIGLEFGLWRRRGGIAAIDMETGAKAWHFEHMPCYTHASPLYIRKHRQVAIGSNDGAVYLFDAKTGKLEWKYEDAVLTEHELRTGFSAYDIKESLAYDAQRDLLICGRLDGSLLFIHRKTGTLAYSFKTENAFISTPLIVGNTVIASCTDKHVYCLDLDTFEVRWKWFGGARIFSSPTLIEGRVYVGGNTARLTELDPETGEEKSFLQLTERITNKTAYNPKTQRFFVPTFANEIYCLEKN